METNETYRYFAFISYKHDDKDWAKWLQKKIESYKLPVFITEKNPDLPTRLRPIFRDETDLELGDLDEKIVKALEVSKFLIVVCSPNAVKSKYVSKEITNFKELGGLDRIVPIIVDGCPLSENEDRECIPEPLKEDVANGMLAANVNEVSKDYALIKVIAKMLSVGIDELWQRFEREKRRKRNWIIAAGITVFLIMAGVAGWMYFQRQQTLKANWKMMENQSRFVAEKIKDISKVDSYLARRLAVEILPKDLMCPERPYTPEAEISLREADFQNTAILRGHTSAVLTAVFSPDGESIVSTSADSTLKIWDVKSGALLKTIRGHTNTVISALFSPDGKKIVSLSNDGTIKIWDLVSGREQKTIVVHDLSSPFSVEEIPLILEMKQSYGMYLVPLVSPNSICISDDNSKISSVCFNNTIRVYDMNTNDFCILKGHTSFVHSVEFSPDGNGLLTASNDSTIRVWDLRLGVPTRTIKSNSRVRTATYSPSGEQIVSVDDDQIIKLWNIDDGSLIKEFKGHTSDVVSVDFSPDGNRIVSASFDNTMIIWDIRSGEAVQILTGHDFPVSSATYSPDGKRIVSASYDNTIRIWDMETKPLNQVIVKDTSAILSFSFSPNGKEIALAREDGLVDIWDVLQKKKRITLIGHKGAVNSLSYCFDGKSLLTASSDGSAIIWDTETGEMMGDFKSDIDINAALFCPDGENVVLSLSDTHYSIVVWNLDLGKIISVMDGHTDEINSIAVSPDGKQIASASNDGTIIVWDVGTSKIVNVFKGHDSFVYHVAFSHDGEKIVSASADLTARVWDINTGKTLSIMKGHSNWVFCAEFSYDDKYVVTSSYHTIRVWDAKSGLLIESFEGNTDWVWSVMIDPSKKHIVSSSNDGYVVYWDFPPLQDLIDQTRKRFKDRPLTPEERRRYYLE